MSSSGRLMRSYMHATRGLEAHAAAVVDGHLKAFPSALYSLAASNAKLRR